MTFRIEPQLGPHPKCYRGVCTNCGRAAPGERALHSWAISLDHEDGHYGDFWLCESCLREWAQAIGMITVDQADIIRASAAELRRENTELRDRLKLYTALEAFLDSRPTAELQNDALPLQNDALPLQNDAIPAGYEPVKPGTLKSGKR